MSKKSKSMCEGCRNDFYNDNNYLSVKECWSYKDAEVRKRWRIHYMTPMATREGFQKVTTLSCYHQVNGYVFVGKLPDHLGGDPA